MTPHDRLAFIESP